jgi:hypothetical protein
MKHSSSLSEREAVAVWLSVYSAELLSVGIKLRLSVRQHNAVENRLLSIESRKLEAVQKLLP